MMVLKVIWKTLAFVVVGLLLGALAVPLCALIGAAGGAFVLVCGVAIGAAAAVFFGWAFVLSGDAAQAIKDAVAKATGDQEGS